MANPQLTAYVTAQLDKGVTRDAIVQALTGAGWAPNDVESAVSEVLASRAGAPAEPQVQPATEQVQPQQPSAEPLSQPASEPATQEPLGASSSPSLGGQSFGPINQPQQSPASVTPASFFSTTGGDAALGATTSPMGSEVDTMQSGGSKGWLVGLIVGIIALIALGAAAYFFLFANGSSVDTDAQAQQLQALQQEKAQFEQQITQLNDDVNDLQAHLAIFQDSDEASRTLTMNGTLRERADGGFTLTTARNITLLLVNTGGTDETEALRPFIGAEVKITGTHTPGSTSVTITDINDQPFADFVAASATVSAAESAEATQ